MGVVKMKFDWNRDSGMSTRLLAATLSQLPDGTKLVDIELGSLCSLGSMLFEHPLFKEGAELIGTYRRDMAVIDNKVINVDHFTGLNLKDVLINEYDQDIDIIGAK